MGVTVGLVRRRERETEDEAVGLKLIQVIAAVFIENV
jgi:hypothetical protein